MFRLKKGKLIWITGLSGAGKTTIGREVYSLLKKKHKNSVFVDGDIFREIMGNEFSHSKKDRLKNARIISRLFSRIINLQGHVPKTHKKIIFKGFSCSKPHPIKIDLEKNFIN